MTTFLDLVKRESEGVRQKIIVTTAVSGFANAAILAIINQAAKTATEDTLNLRYLLMFIVAMALYIICLRFSSREMNKIMIGLVHRMRLRVTDKVQNSELSVLEAVGKGAILNAVSQEATIVADSGGVIIGALQATITVIFAAVYIAYLSLPAFVLTAICAAAGVALVLKNRAQSSRWIQSTKTKEIDLLTHVTHAIDGFKETKLNQRRREDLRRELHRTSADINDLRVRTEEVLSDDIILAQSAFYVLIAVVVFVLPRLIDTYTQVIIEITTAILFIIGPLRLMVGQVPYFSKCNEATAAILRLEEALDKGHELARNGAERPSVVLPRAFRTIALNDVRYAYRSDGNELFALGPVSFTINAGEIVFLIGGNGSGKSTLLKVIAGLYPPDAGSIEVDGVPVAATDLQSYRELFSAIFSDFHLFERVYGLLGTDEQAVSQLLQEMQLARKVRFVDDRFTTLDLSTGQRKRLALIVSILDHKPVFIFDELAADQDPDFRRFLYEALLPRLKADGSTVIAATHDDRYFHVADTIIKMEYGKAVYVQPKAVV